MQVKSAGWGSVNTCEHYTQGHAGKIQGYTGKYSPGRQNIGPGGETMMRAGKRRENAGWGCGTKVRGPLRASKTGIRRDYTVVRRKA